MIEQAPGGIGWLIGRVVPLAVVLGNLAAVFLAWGFRNGPERHWLFSVIEYAPYPVFLLPFLVLVAAAFLVGRVWVLLALAGLIFVATEVMDLEIHLGESGSNRIRVLTFNVKDYLARREPFGLADIANEIARHDPDIFVLQDARSFQQDVIDPTFARGLFGDRETYKFGQYVIASRFPLHDCRNGWISFRDEPHTYATCVVSIQGKDIHLVTTHFMTPRSGLAATRFNPIRGMREWTENVSDRMTQARLLAADLHALDRPVIVAGDLNSPTASLVVRTLLDTGLRDAFSVAGLGYGYTWGHSLRFRFSFLRIDHILVSREFRVARSFVGHAAGSAHRPVIADLYLSGEAR